MPHVCIAPKDGEETVAIVSRETLKSLREGAFVFGILEENLILDFFREIEKADYELVERAIKHGQMAIRTPEETYFEGGRFETKQMLLALETLLRGARKRGFPRFFLFGSAGFVGQKVPGSEKFFEYEAGVNRILKGDLDVSVMCIYPKNIFGESLIEEAFLIHGQKTLKKG